MNHYNLQLIVDERLAERYTEAERSRIARSGHRQTTGQRSSGRTRRPGRHAGMLSTVFDLVAHF